MKIECSSTFTGSTSLFSPSGRHIASVSGSRLTVRSLATTQTSDTTTSIFQCVDRIDKFTFSPDSTMVLCALFSRNVVQAFSLVDKDWKCRINEGVAGLINVYWAPDSSCILTESDYGIQLTVWSLTTGGSYVISLPKPHTNSPYSQNVAFSDCGRLFLVLHRVEHHDHIGVYSVEQPVGEIAKFRAKSNDIVSVSFVPNGTHIVAIDSPLAYRCCVYTPMGTCVATFEAYAHALGIRCLGVFKSPSFASPPAAPTTSTSLATISPASAAVGSTNKDKSTFLALGSFDSKIRLMSMHSWQVAFTLPLAHPKDIDAGFNCSNLLLTVEVASSTAGAETMSGLTAEMLAVSSASTSASSSSVLAPTQVPPSQQHMRSSYLRDMGTSGTSGGGAGMRGNTMGGGRINSSTSASSINSSSSNRKPKMSGFNRELAEAINAGNEDNTENGNASHESVYVLRQLKALPTSSAVTTGKSTGKSIVKSVGKSIGKSGATTTASAAALVGVGAGGFPAVGVQWIGWSCSGQYLAAREESHPRCLWIWQPHQAQLVAVLVQLEPITSCHWRPRQQTTAAAMAASAKENLPNIPPTIDIGRATAATSSGEGEYGVEENEAGSGGAPPLAPSSVNAHAATSTTASVVIGENGEGEDSFCTTHVSEEDVLAISTGSGRVYFWTPSRGATWCDLTAIGDNSVAAMMMNQQQEQQEQAKNTRAGSGGSSGSSTVSSSIATAPTAAAAAAAAAAMAVDGLGSGDIGFAVTSMRWTEDGNFLLLRGKESHCVCRVTINHRK